MWFDEWGVGDTGVDGNGVLGTQVLTVLGTQVSYVKRTRRFGVGGVGMAVLGTYMLCVGCWGHTCPVWGTYKHTGD